MTTYEFDLLVFIGRFQPPHIGHFHVIREALKRATRVMVLVGSANSARNVRNPWTAKEREAMLRASLDEAENARVIVKPLSDEKDDPRWIQSVQALVSGTHYDWYGPAEAPRIALIGHKKDGTSYYLHKFREWDSVDVPSIGSVNASDIRHDLFTFDADGKPTWAANSGAWDRLLDKVPAATRDAMADTKGSMDQVRREAEHAAKYKASWHGPYAPMFITTDTVVTQAGHVLLVKRGAYPGMGLIALPGGFLLDGKSLKESAIHHLMQKTGIKMPARALLDKINKTETFDAPYRSDRGRTVSHAFRIDLDPSHDFPAVSGQRRTKDAFWLPLSKLNQEAMYEDHYFIIQQMLGL